MRVIQIAPEDNVAVALCPITAGEVIQIGEQAAVKVLEDVPQGHKIALKEIKKEENIIKYGFAIGHATAEIKAGSWVHTHCFLQKHLLSYVSDTSHLATKDI